MILGLGIGGLICWLCYCSVFSLPLAVVIAVIYMKQKKKQILEKRRRMLLYHFKDFLSAMHGALRSGYAAENAVVSALADMKQLYGEDDVMVREAKYMVSALKYRKPVEELFLELGDRSSLEDIRFFAELLAIGKRMGGSLGKILQDSRKIICEKIETEQEIDEQLASKKYEQKIMSLVPAAIILYLRLTFNGFIEQLYGNFTGVLIMTGCLIVYAGAYYMGMKMIRIEV